MLNTIAHRRPQARVHSLFATHRVGFQALRPQRWYFKRRRPTQRQEKALTVFATVRGVGSSPFKFSSCSAIFGKLCPSSRKMTALRWLAKLRLRGPTLSVMTTIGWARQWTSKDMQSSWPQCALHACARVCVRVCMCVRPLADKIVSERFRQFLGFLTVLACRCPSGRQ